MRKLIILALCLAIILSASVIASMECSVVRFNNCPQTSVKIIGMTSLSSGGSHASIPTEQTNAFVACCSGVEGLSVEYVNQDADIYLTSARDAHASRVSNKNGLKITGVSCGYFRSCDSYDACVFSITADRDAHISDCGNYAFSTKLCCREGGLIGEQLRIEPEVAGIQEEKSLLPSLQEKVKMPVAEPLQKQFSESRPEEKKPRRIGLPSHIKRFLRNFLRGGLVGSFLRVP